MTPIEKLRKARETNVVSNGRTFTIRRPTDAQVMNIGKSTGLDIVKLFVVGWDLREIDVLPAGTNEAIPFDADLWSEWVEDHPELWGDLSAAIKGAYLNYEKARDAARKN